MLVTRPLTRRLRESQLRPIAQLLAFTAARLVAVAGGGTGELLQAEGDERDASAACTLALNPFAAKAAWAWDSGGDHRDFQVRFLLSS